MAIVTNEDKVSHNDPGLGWTDPAIAHKQRAVVDEQLSELVTGNPIQLFRVLGGMLVDLRSRSSIGRITLLDAGCGSAYYWEVMEHYVPGWVKYTGVDLNRGSLRLGRKKYPGLKLRQGDICNLKFPDMEFDMVFSGACIAHIKDWKVALAELKRVAARWLFLHRTPVGEASLSVLHSYGRDMWLHRFDERELLEEMSGWLLLESREVGRNKHGPTNSYLFQRQDHGY